MGIFNKILGDPNEKVIKKLESRVAEINVLEKEFAIFSDEQLKGLKDEFKQLIFAEKEKLSQEIKGLEIQFNSASVAEEKLKIGKKLNDVRNKIFDPVLPRAFAAVREAAKRTLGQRHYDVQLIGGIILHQGQIAEMRTGEGKTLSSTLPIFLNALEGLGVHLVTVNDYLAKRDTVWMGQIYHALGLTVGCIQHESAFIYDPDYQAEKIDDYNRDKDRDETGSFRVEKSYLRPVPRKTAYEADITYGTNNEFGFDYLRDNMAQKLEQMVQRELNYAIVDEIDSILIDEARTPLIISAPDSQSSDMYAKFSVLVKKLRENIDYNIDEKMRAATLTDEGISKIEKWLGMGNIYTEGGISMVHHIEQALKAETLFKKDRDYVVKEGEIIIVDEFTGRLMQGRRYSEGLHQAIEAKEGVAVQRESRTLATITFQNYFRLYKKLAGMTGTAATEAEEFSKIYNLEVTIIPTNKPMVRKDFPDRIYKNEAGKYEALVKEIKERHEKGQPILIGTISIEKNEVVGELLSRAGINYQILNAKQHEKEGQIIAQAGRLEAVTVATNMAGRGVDIILGGNPSTAEESQKVKELGGLHIIGTERHESRRIDNQLRGRAGRQGDLGSSQFFLSTEDDLMRVFGSSRIKGIMEALKIPDDMPIENKMISRSLEAAQKKVEGHNFDIRKHLVEYDDVINKHREVIYKKRREILKKENLKDDILQLIMKEIEQVVMFHTADDNENKWNLEEIYEVSGTIFNISREARIKISDIGNQAGDKLEDAKSRTKIINYLHNLAVQEYNFIEEKINGHFQDEKAMRNLEREMYLRAIDMLWMEHIDAMDQLRSGIGLRGYGQRDPLIEYKKEAYKMFTELMNLIQKQIVYSIYKAGIVQQLAPGIMEQMRQKASFSAPAKTMERGASFIPVNNQGGNQMRREVERRQSQGNIENIQTHYQGQKVGRNDPCPCGSGKKFKKCHGA